MGLLSLISVNYNFFKQVIQQTGIPAKMRMVGAVSHPFSKPCASKPRPKAPPNLTQLLSIRVCRNLSLHRLPADRQIPGWHETHVYPGLQTLLRLLMPVLHLLYPPPLQIPVVLGMHPQTHLNQRILLCTNPLP